MSKPAQIEVEGPFKARSDRLLMWAIIVFNLAAIGGIALFVLHAFKT